ncbi:hypothetical protein ACOME3_008966 [Neoechinorhynchus agilis]
MPPILLLAPIGHFPLSRRYSWDLERAIACFVKGSGPGPDGRSSMHLKDILSYEPIRLGHTSCGTQRTVHAIRTLVENSVDPTAFLKMDYRKAFSTVNGTAKTIANDEPKAYGYFVTAYGTKTH